MSSSVSSVIFQANIGGVSVFDVRGNSWLNEKNGISFLFQSKGRDTGYLALSNTGSIVRYSNSRHISKTLMSADGRFDVNQVIDSVPGFVRFLNVVMGIEINNGIFHNGTKKYKKLGNGDAFFLKKTGTFDFELEPVIKGSMFEKPSREDINGWSHSKVDKPKSYSVFMKGATPLLFTVEERDALESMASDEAYLGNYTRDEYVCAASLVNSAVVRVALAVGPRSSFKLHSYRTGVSSVTLGKLRVELQVNGADYIDMVLFDGNKEVARRDGLSSVPSCECLSGGIFGSKVMYSEIENTAMAMLKTAQAKETAYINAWPVV